MHVDGGRKCCVQDVKSQGDIAFLVGFEPDVGGAAFECYSSDSVGASASKWRNLYDGFVVGK